MSEAIITELHALLDREKQALMAADFDPLAELLAQKETLLHQLACSKPTTDLLGGIQTKMDENQTLLAAAIKGVSAARDRLEALKTVQNTLSTYAPDGRVELALNRRRSLEKKA